MRFLIYSPDSYGLGHIRRSTLLAETYLQQGCGNSVLLLTGAPRAQLFEYRPGCDFIKLPAISKDSGGRYISRDPGVKLGEAVRLRERMIRGAAESFRADAMLVDHNPLGLCGEILPTLRRLGKGPRKTVRVLGMRDVIDDAHVVKAAWKRDGVIDVLDECYDLIMVYGEQKIYDPVRSYGIPQRIARKMVFVGYIPRNGRRTDSREMKARLAPRTGKLVAVTLGGSGDGDILLDSFFKGFEALGPNAPFEVVAITGPLMSHGDRKRFGSWARKLSGLTLLEYTPQLPDLVEAADMTVSMGGYNTVCELACAGARSIIVPRTFPRKEQLIRAQLLARRGVTDYVVGDAESRAPDPDALLDRVVNGLNKSRPRRGWGLDFRGLEFAAKSVARLLPPRSLRQPIGLRARGGLPVPSRNWADRC